MMNEKENKRISKFLSFVLRHKPEIIDLVLDKNGWANTADLLEKMNKNGLQVNAEILAHVVATNSKKRFSFNEDKTCIRASQGHSIAVELDLEEAEPPEILYHGTGEKAVESILATGLEKRERQHVHLSSDIATARMVGQRHGKVKVLLIAAGEMRKDGFSFFISANNVWLIDHVPVRYLRLSDNDKA